MNSELVVDVQPKEISIALLEDGRLVEMNKEVREQVYAVGNIYYGRVKKIMPGLNAAFVDIGYGKDAFLHYLDLGSTFNTLYNYTLQAVSDKKRMPLMTKAKTFPDLEKNGMIGDVLKVGQELLVQVAKEPISTKGPRLTAEISIAGRYLVLIPFAEKVALSVHGGLGLDCGLYASFKDSDNDSVEPLATYYGEEAWPKRFNAASEIGVGLRIGSLQISALYSKGFFNHKFYTTENGYDYDYKTTQNKYAVSISWLFSSN